MNLEEYTDIVVPSHNGIEPGQTYVSKMGTLYKVYACLRNGYILCLRSDGVKRIIWCDVIQDMYLQAE